MPGSGARKPSAGDSGADAGMFNWRNIPKMLELKELLLTAVSIQRFPHRKKAFCGAT